MILVENLILESKKTRQKHLDLREPCIEIGGGSTQFKGLLAYFLKTNIPQGKIASLCHACHNGKCSNVKHLYWGTRSENAYDAIENKTNLGVREYTVRKYGIELANAMNSRSSESAAKSGRGNLGKSKPKSEEHKRKISEAIKRKYETNSFSSSPGRKSKRV